MKQIVAIIEKAIFLILIQATVFLTRPSQWALGIFTLFRESSLDTWQLFISNLLFSSLGLLALFALFAVQTTTPARILFGLFFKKTVWLALGIRLLTGIIYEACRLIPSGWMMGVGLTVEATGIWLLCMTFRRTLYQPDFPPVQFSLWKIAVGICAALGLLTLCSVMAENSMSSISYLLSRDTDPSAALIVLNADMPLQLVEAAYLAYLWIIICSVFGLLLPGKTASRSTVARQASVALLRIAMLAVTLSWLYFFKWIILPTGLISISDTPFVKSTQWTSKIDVLTADYTVVHITRLNSAKQGKPIYHRTSVTLRWNGDSLITFHRMHGENPGHLKSIVLADGQIAYAYENDALVFPNEHGQMIAVKLDQIGAFAVADEGLTNLCETLIEQNQFDILEAAYPYLARFDPTWIHDYVQQTPNENYYASNSQIQPTYIDDFFDHVRD